MRIYGICNTSQCDALKISRNLENVPSAAPSLVGFLRFLVALILRSFRLICMKSSNLPNRTDSCPIWRTFRRNAFERDINLFLSIRLKTSQPEFPGTSSLFPNLTLSLTIFLSELFLYTIRWPWPFNRLWRFTNSQLINEWKINSKEN